MKIKIGIVDTGVNLLHPMLVNKSIKCKKITGNSCVEFSGNSDLIGHGTAICGIISQASTDAEITMYKAFDSRDAINEHELIKVLEYIYKYENFHILNLSLGTCISSELLRLRDVCCNISQKGTIIVSAFNNLGAVTYPAAFPFIIGVDWNGECKKSNEFIFCQNGMVKVYAKGVNQKVYWSNKSDYIVNAGASFAAAHVSAYIATKYSSGEINDFESALEMLKNNAKRIIGNELIASKTFPKCRNIAAFPFNKEIQSLTNYSDMLKTSLVSIYDIRQSGKVGRSTIDFSFRKDKSTNYIIKNIDDIQNDCEYFDTLVLGHIGEICQATNFDYYKYCIDFCIDNKKNLISFDTLSPVIIDRFRDSGLTCFNTNISEITYDSSEKLRLIGIPIITIIGTDSKQGKFSLQLNLREKFNSNGYRVGQWSSEPQAYLFGIDQVFPYGYGANIRFSEKEVIHLINYQLHQIELNNPDIIISGTQSFILPEKLYNTRRFPSLQNAILSALQPDTLVIVVNCSDSDSLILRTIRYAESLTNSKTACIVLSHKKTTNSWSPLELNEQTLSQEECEYYKKRIQKLSAIPVFSSNELDSIYETIVNYLENEV